MSDSIELSVRAGLRDLVLARLVADLPEIKGGGGLPIIDRRNITLSPAWPADPDAWPAVHVDAPFASHTLTSGNGMPPDFDLLVQVEIRAVVQGADEATVQARLDLFEAAITQALLCSQEFLSEITSIQEMNTSTDVIPGGDRPQGQLGLRLLVKVGEGFRTDFEQDLSSLALRIDLAEPADLLGTYPPEDGFPAAEPAPRESGPDGRIEIGADITFPPT